MDLNTKGFIKKKVSFALKMIVLVICFIIYMFPFVMVVINSFKTKRDIIKEPLSQRRVCCQLCGSLYQDEFPQDVYELPLCYRYQRSAYHRRFLYVRLYFRAYGL